MLRRTTLLVLSIAIGWMATACGANQIQRTTVEVTPSKTATTRPATIPPITPTIPPETKPGPAPATAEATSAASPACFTTTDTNLFAFMPDSFRILVRTGSGVKIINLKTLQEESSIQAPKNIIAAALSPDGQTLAWSLDDNTIQLVRISDHKIISTLQGHTDMVGKLRFSPTGDRLVSASHDTWVRIWDLQGKQLDAFQPTGADNLPSEVLGMGISPDGMQLATIPFDGPVKVWDLANKKEAFELGGSGGFDTSDAAFSADGQLVAADLATGLSLWRIPNRAQLLSGINSMAFAFSPDGRFLTYADIGQDNRIILSSPDGTQLIRTLEGPQAHAWELIFSPDNSLLASAGVEIRIWRVEDGGLAYVGKAACP